MSSTNNRAGNAAPSASRKRKSTGNQVGSSSKRVALELFPTHPANGGQISSGPHNSRSFTSLLNSDHHDTNVQSPPREDPFERLFKSQYEQMRETCKQYLNNKYNDILRQAEERAYGIHKEKEMSMISHFQERLASLNDIINNKNTELDNSSRRNIELEEQVVHFKSQAEIWKGKAERAEEILWNVTVSPRRHGPCCCEDEEDTALSSVGETREVVKGAIDP